MDFIKNWKSSIIAVIALVIGVLGQMFPEYKDLIAQVQVFLLAILAFFTKDADVSGTKRQPR